jgi:hypothetical protein
VARHGLAGRGRHEKQKEWRMTFDAEGPDDDFQEVESLVKEPTIVGELSRIHDENGGLTAKIVVEEARLETSPLHRCFEWDDGEAGQKYREWQARRLIRVVVTKEEGQPSAPVFVHVTDTEGPRYIKVSEAIKKPDLFQIALNELAVKLRAATQSVDSLLRAGGNPQKVMPLQKHLQRANKSLERISATH